MERYSNLSRTTVVGGYTAGSGVLNVASVAGDNDKPPFPTGPNFRVALADPTTGAVKVLLKVTGVNSSTQWAVTPEGADANASADDVVRPVLTAGALDAIKQDAVQGLILSGAYASKPAAGAAGRIYLPTDSQYDRLFDNGSSWDHFYQGFKMTPPPDVSMWAWVSQEDAAAVSQGGVLTLHGPGGGSGSNNFRILKRAAPATPYVITAWLIPNMFPSNYASAGLCFRRSSDGKLVTFGLTYSNLWLISSYSWNSPTSYSSTYSAVPNVGELKLIGLRIADNGINRVLSYMIPGLPWVEYHSHSRTDFMTADEVGVQIDVTGAAARRSFCSFISWEQS
jgi:hypothetical protein